MFLHNLTGYATKRHNDAQPGKVILHKIAQPNRLYYKDTQPGKVMLQIEYTELTLV